MGPLSALDEDNLNLQNAMRILKEDPESLLAFKHTIKDKIELLLKQLYPGEELYKAFAQVTKIHPDILGENDCGIEGMIRAQAAELTALLNILVQRNKVMLALRNNQYCKEQIQQWIG